MICQDVGGVEGAAPYNRSFGRAVGRGLAPAAQLHTNFCGGAKAPPYPKPMDLRRGRS